MTHHYVASRPRRRRRRLATARASRARATNKQQADATPSADWANIVHTQGLENRLRLQHDFVKADWDAEASLYHVTLRDTANDRDVHVDAQVIVGATGAFSEPRRIPLPGEDQFQGQIIHSARWPHDLAPKDLRGKTVVVVGNGCSGCVVPRYDIESRSPPLPQRPNRRHARPRPNDQGRVPRAHAAVAHAVAHARVGRRAQLCTQLGAAA